MVATGTGEGVLRIYGWWRGWTPNCYAGQLHLFRPQPEVGCDPQPGFRFRSGVSKISINALGLRGPEIVPEKPPGVRRVAIVGESSAFGYLVSDEQVAARLLEAALQKQGRQVEVLNAAVPGYNLNQSLVRFREVVAPLKPDVVVAYLGWNDLAYVVSDDPGAERFRFKKPAPAWERLLGHSMLYGFVAYRVLGGPVRMMPAAIGGTQPTRAGARVFHERLAQLADEVHAAGASLVICAQATAARTDAAPGLAGALSPDPQVRAQEIDLARWLRDTEARFAAERGLLFLDASAAIPPNETMLGDYVHLTAEGERKLAEFWSQKLSPLLRSQSRPARDPPRVDEQ